MTRTEWALLAGCGRTERLTYTDVETLFRHIFFNVVSVSLYLVVVGYFFDNSGGGNSCSDDIEAAQKKKERKQVILKKNVKLYEI